VVVTIDRDDDLRTRFAALRAADAVRAPAFDARPREHARGRALAWSGGALAFAAVVALSLAWRDQAPGTGRTASATPEVMLHVASEMPSDFLLGDAATDVRRDAPAFVTDTNDEVPFL
jgi:hypothetical protein